MVYETKFSDPPHSDQMFSRDNYNRIYRLQVPRVAVVSNS